MASNCEYVEECENKGTVLTIEIVSKCASYLAVKVDDR